MSFKEYYFQEVRPKLAKKMGLTNLLTVPQVVKIVVNVGAGEAVVNKGVLEKISEQITLITGQKPIVTKAREAVSAFKIRKGFPIGVKATLRGERMYQFLEKIIKIILPRLRDFRGISLKSLDSSGNLNLGFREQIIFPEIDFDKIDKIRGLQVTIVTNCKDKEKGRLLFEELGIIFKK